jgi:hypothetical protein
VFFSLMITGLATSLPSTLSAGLRAQGVPGGVAACMAAIAAVASPLRGRRYLHDERESGRPAAPARVRRVAR